VEFLSLADTAIQVRWVMIRPTSFGQTGTHSLLKQLSAQSVVVIRSECFCLSNSE